MTGDGWRRVFGELPQFVPEFTVDPRRSALVIVDMQKFGVVRDVGLGPILVRRYPELAEGFFQRIDQVVVPNISRLLDFYRRHDLRVIFVTVGPFLSNAADYFPRRRRRDEHRSTDEVTIFPVGSLGHQVIEPLQPRPGELVVNKTSMSPFNSTGIDQTLRNLRIEGLVLTGVGTHACVETTGRDAADRGYDVYLVEDACASIHPRLHDSTLLSFALLSGKVKKTQQILHEFKAALDPSMRQTGEVSRARAVSKSESRQ